MEASFPQIQELDLAELAEKPEWKTMLIDIVSQENLNPWDIDIAVLTSGFAGRIKKMKLLDLKISANVMLAASILLRYKSDSWVLKEEERDDVFFIPDEIYAEPVFPELRPVQRTTRRKVSLQELISAVEDIMKREKHRAARRIIPPIDLPPSLVAMMEDSGESFESRLDRIMKKLKKAVDSTGLALFSQLLDQRDIESVIGSLLPLLHLANRGTLTMWQEEVFGEIFIHLAEDVDKKEGAKRGKRRPKKAG